MQPDNQAFGRPHNRRKVSDIWRRLRRKVLTITWRLWEYLGLHIVPDHYHYPIPNTKTLLAKKPWDQLYSLNGVELRESEQINLLQDLAQYMIEYHPKDTGFESNGDGAILYAMVRAFRPRQIIEVGSGASTRVALKASDRNEAEGHEPTLILAVEPNPSDSLRYLDACKNNLRLLDIPVEEVPFEYWHSMTDGDFLFIDSSHVVAPGNDVVHLYLRVLPVVEMGVLIHIHDIRYPADYPRKWLVEKHYLWTEQYLLHAFLLFNSAFRVLWAGNFMSMKYPKLLERYLVGYELDKGWPGSFWIQRIRR